MPSRIRDLDGNYVQAEREGEGAGAAGIDYAQNTDPGAVGAKKTWLRTDVSGNAGYSQLFVRNDADDGWNAAGPVVYVDAAWTIVTSPDGQTELGMATQVNGGDTYVTSPSGYIDLPWIKLGGLVAMAAGSADPSAGAGVAAPLASHFMRQNGVVGELWVKTGAADTAWTKVV